MRHLPRPRSNGFRAMLGMALLAWAMLASGALAGTLRADPSGMTDAVQMTAAHADVAHCDAISMQQADSQRVSVPIGHGCCQTSCHCLSTCSVMLSVPSRGAAGSVQPRMMLPAIASATFAQTSAAPPLRPPIA